MKRWKSESRQNRPPLVDPGANADRRDSDKHYRKDFAAGPGTTAGANNGIGVVAGPKLVPVESWSADQTDALVTGAWSKPFA